jgi:hypothetical protein
MTWKYADQSRRIVVSEDGRQSCLASALAPEVEILPPDAPPPEARKAALESAVQEHLDAVARADGWDSIYTAMARAGFPGPFHDHGMKLATWADQCWAKVIQVENDVLSGKIAEPTAAELLAMLPDSPQL